MLPECSGMLPKCLGMLPECSGILFLVKSIAKPLLLINE